MASNDKRRKEDGEVSGEEGEEVTSGLRVEPKRSRSSRSRSEDKGSRKNKVSSANSNGGSSRTTNRDKDRERERDRDRDREREKDREREREREKDRERERNREKDRQKERDRERDRDRDRQKDKDREDRDRADRNRKRKDSRSPRSRREKESRKNRSRSPRRKDSSRSPPRRRDRSSRSPAAAAAATAVTTASNRGNAATTSDKRETSHRRSRSLVKNGGQPKSYLGQPSNVSGQSYSRRTDNLTDAELRELEEANDRPYSHAYSDSDDDDYYRSRRRPVKPAASKKYYDDDDEIEDNNAYNKRKEQSQHVHKVNTIPQPVPAPVASTTVNNYEEETKLMMGMINVEDENSEDERERKKQEMLEIIKGMKKTAQKQSQQQVQPIVEEKIEEDEAGFDNDLINPDDAVDVDDEDGNIIVTDDYQGENDAAIAESLKGKQQLNNQSYLKNLEEMRNKETKEGLGDTIFDAADEIDATAAAAVDESGVDSSKFEWKEQNKMHQLDEKSDSESEPDMFDDDIEKFVGVDKEKTTAGGSKANPVRIVSAECDDDQQYFKIRIGEVLAGKYRITEKCGKGVFANVCKAEQLDNNKIVAIKILRSNEIMHESGTREKEIIQRLNLSDKNDKKHIIRLKNVFEHHKHICLVFECFAMNLREALKQFGKGKGFSLDVVRSYAFQMFIAMTHLKKNRLIHADLKPDNMLISEDTKTLKMCDFGTALSVEENGIIKYIQSRYYRAPEVLLGYPPYNQIDVWSIGVTLYEIYTQKYLFDGTSNNEMIKLIMDARGKFNKKMLQSGTFVDEYFDLNHVFQYVQVDPLTKQKYVTAIKYGDIPKKDISKLLLENKEGVQYENQKKLAQFKDFLDKCLQLDPKNRLSPEDALRHPFLDTTNKQQK